MTHIKDGGKLHPLKILGIARRKCKTSVYNLAVDEDESYIANGIVVHNCRSTLVPLGPGDDIDEFDFITAADVAKALDLSSSAFGGTGRYSEEVPSRKGRLYLEDGERYDYYSPDQARKPSGDESGGEFAPGAGNPNSGPASKIGPKNKLKKAAGGKKKVASKKKDPNIIDPAELGIKVWMPNSRDRAMPSDPKLALVEKGGSGYMSADDTYDANLPLSPSQQFALVDYTGEGYSKINNALRKGRLTAAQGAYVEALNSALDSLPLMRGTVYRGASLNTAALELFKKKVGGEIVESAYTSTSKHLDRAANPVSDEAKAPNVLFQIKSRTGRYIGAEYSQMDEEDEVLFKPATRFKILSVGEKKLGSDSFPIVYMEEVTTKTKKK